jgi:mono/diheme cytochrome c family protein
MKVLRLALAALGALVALGVGFSAYALLTVGDGRETNALQPSVAGAPASIKEPLARGEYLARAADCIACHTLPGGQPFSGGVAFKTPFGTIYSSNITADKETGIGTWSDDDFVRAVVQNSLQYLAPEDVAALAAYLRDVEPQRGRAGIEVNDRPPSVLASTANTPGADEMAQWDRGLHLFERTCTGCHLWNGQGRQSKAAALVGTRAVNDAEGFNLTQIILQGSHLQTAHGEIFMPSFGRAYSDAEVSALGNFMLRHFGGKQGTLTAADVSKGRAQ